MRISPCLKTLKIFLLGVPVDYSHFFQPDWLETAHCSSVGWNHCLWASSKANKIHNAITINNAPTLFLICLILHQ